MSIYISIISHILFLSFAKETLQPQSSFSTAASPGVCWYLQIDCVPCRSLRFLISADLPEITQGPESLSVATGTDATFTVEATGDDLQFQWQKNRVNIDSSEPRFNCNSTGNASNLHIQHTEKSDIGHYRCLVKNPIEKSGKPSNEADLLICKFVILHCKNICTKYVAMFFSSQLIPLILPKLLKATQSPLKQAQTSELKLQEMIFSSSGRKIESILTAVSLDFNATAVEMPVLFTFSTQRKVTKVTTGVL